MFQITAKETINHGIGFPDIVWLPLTLRHKKRFKPWHILTQSSIPPGADFNLSSENNVENKLPLYLFRCVLRFRDTPHLCSPSRCRIAHDRD